MQNLFVGATGTHMLVLSRKCNEQIVIGDDIVVTVVAIRGGTVRIGIDAPPHVTVHRQEVLEAIRASEANRSRSGNEPQGNETL
jgi:carbon storage regulator